MGRHRRPPVRGHQLRRAVVGRAALAALVGATAPAVVLTSAPVPVVVEAPPPAPELLVPDPPAPPTPVRVVSCADFPAVDSAQTALDGDRGLAPLLDTDRDGNACEVRWPRTPLDTAGDAVKDVVDDVTDTLAGRCDDSGFGGVAAHVAVVGNHLQARFPLGRILGVGSRADNPTSDHPRGLALDLFATRTAGDDLAAYVLDRRAELGVTYVIWRQRINYGNGWEPMTDRGGITANHYDHVHLSFRAGAAAADLPC